jgi:F-type H+-transporting ATPase subunit epsilon
MDTMNFSLVTPEATFFSGLVSMVEAPGTLGDFGVLPGHMNFISTLRPGIVTIHDDVSQITKLFVESGIAEVNPTSCTILAEKMLNLSKITRVEAEARLANAKANLDNSQDERAKVKANHELELAEAIVAALV